MAGLIWDPAGPDKALAQAATSARADRAAGIAEVMADSRGNWELRAHRSLVLGSACVESDIAEQWLRDEPQSPDALLLYARTAVARVLRAAEAGAPGTVGAWWLDEGRGGAEPRQGGPTPRWVLLAQIALRACREAAAASPEDPTPLVALLALSRLGHTPEPGPEGIEDVTGPWRLLNAALARDKFNREAYLRFQALTFARYGGSHDAMWTFARYVAAHTPFDSDPQLLVLIAYAEHYRARAKDPDHFANAERQWATPQAQANSLDLLEDGWFEHARARRFPPIQDLSYLAHALYAGDRISEAREVLSAMGRYAAAMPWSLFGDAAAEFDRARRQCGIDRLVLRRLRSDP